MAKDFSLKRTIDRTLATVTLTGYKMTPRTMPVDVARQVAARSRIWTWGAYDHEITVNGNGWSFTHRWNSDSDAFSSLGRRFLAEKVDAMQQRMKYVETRKAA